MGFFSSAFHGLSNAFKSSPILQVAAPILLGLATGGIGSALGGGLTGALGGAATGALGGSVISNLEGRNGLTGALLGGVGGGIGGAGGLGSILGSSAQPLADGTMSAGSGILGALGPVGTALGDAGTSIGNGFSSLGNGVESALGIGGNAPASGMAAGSGINSALTSGSANVTAPFGSGASAAGPLATSSAYGAEGFSPNPGGYASAVGSMAPSATAPAQGLLGTLSGAASGLGSKLLSNPASLLSAAGNIYSGYAGKNAAQQMADAQLTSTNEALAQQNKQFGQTQANLAPYQATGAAATGNLGQLLSGDPATQQAALEATPGYQFQLQQGTKAMNQGLAAKGNLFSGDALKAAQTFGQGLADTTFNNTVNQNQTAANSGQSAALGLGGLGAGNAAANTGLLTDQGNIGANQINNSNNAVNQSLSNLLGLQQYDIYGRPLRASAYGARA